MAQRGPRNVSDPALDRPRLLTDMCRNLDLPYGTFSIDHLVSRCLLLEMKFNLSTTHSLAIHYALELFKLPHSPSSGHAGYFSVFASCVSLRT
ncbi:hypothetical protein BDW60DRAFT_184589 [Aspergillus nidulans var. acristatus]